MPQLPGNTTTSQLEYYADKSPHKLAIIASDIQGNRLASVSYQELDERARLFAESLRQKGCSPKDKIVLATGNNIAFFVALFACHKLRCVAVPVDAKLALPELNTIIRHASPVLMIVDDVSAHLPLQLSETLNFLHTKNINTTAKQDPPLAVSNHTPISEDPALLLYTSGTTGAPKGVEYKQRVLTSKTTAIKRHFDFDDSFVSLCLLPTHFGHGLICNSLSTLSYGGTLVITPAFNLDLLSNLMRILDKYQVNTFSSVPTVIRLLMEYAQYEDIELLSSLRFVTCASAPLSSEDINKFETITRVPLLNCYGLTETAGWIACSSRKKPSRPSVGYPLCDEIRVVNTQGVRVSDGDVGEIQVRGPSVMSGYYQVAEMPGAISKEGWFSTGDIGEIDPSGEISLHSRIKELIIRAGKNIYPAEVDAVVMKHPQVKEACTVGLEDPLLGETVATCIVLENNGSSMPPLDSSFSMPLSAMESSIIEFSRANLADYKCPQRIKFVEKIAKNSRGKINRLNLRSEFEQVCSA